MNEKSIVEEDQEGEDTHDDESREGRRGP